MDRASDDSLVVDSFLKEHGGESILEILGRAAQARHN